MYIVYNYKCMVLANPMLAPYGTCDPVTLIRKKQAHNPALKLPKPHLLLAPHVKRLHVRPCTPSRGRAAAGVPQVSQICKSL